MLGAAELFYADNHRWPISVSEMVALKYLSTTVASNGGVSPAHAANAWTMVAPGLPVFVQPSTEVDVCRSFNQSSYGLDGVLPLASTQLVSQCFGQPTGTLRYLVGRNGEQLLAAVAVPDSLVGVEDVYVGPVPAALDLPAWSVPPTPVPVAATPEASVPGGAQGLGITPPTWRLAVWQPTPPR